ncbi:SPFH domain-containing protein [Gorillibacterium timonense]|uniref:SPFH domain-containing protein n=1 Tax=Gorillibacterium timonense TaxID=1689269 RepID=UPI00071D15EE|nr:SPFH domain-containing protein [Gorillibacterium timonense]
MPLIRVLKYDGAPDVLVWKYPNAELGRWTQLIVNQSQEALLVKGGEALDLFGPGRHTLKTENIPILSSLVNLPFGGSSPFTAEVWYVNKLNRLDVKWGTPTPIQLQEPKYQTFVAVRAFGQFGVQVEDTRKFLHKLVGTLAEFTQDALLQYFRGILMMNIKEIITGYLVSKRISVFDIHAYASEIARTLEENVRPVFQEHGLRLFNFTIDSINLPDDDASTNRLKEALAKKAEMNIIGYSYQQERSFSTLEEGAKTMHGGSGMVDTIVGLGIGQQMAGNVARMTGEMAGHMQIASTPVACPYCRTANEKDSTFCRKCGKSLLPEDLPGSSGSAAPKTGSQAIATCNSCGKQIPIGSKFCPECGDEYRACPQCGFDNDSSAVYCSNCQGLLITNCPSCEEPVQADDKFCRKCGHGLGE